MRQDARPLAALAVNSLLTGVRGPMRAENERTMTIADPLARSWFGLRVQAATFVAGVVLIGAVDISAHLG